MVGALCVGDGVSDFGEPLRHNRKHDQHLHKRMFVGRQVVSLARRQVGGAVCQ